jgi:hypothetical protein
MNIGSGVTNIGAYAFDACDSLTNVTFAGNAPVAGTSIFYNASQAIVYYLAGTANWGATYGGQPTEVYTLPVQPNQIPAISTPSVSANLYTFTIKAATNSVVIVEACTNIINPVWVPIQTNTITVGSLTFHDPQSMNCPGRFYRLRSP